MTDTSPVTVYIALGSNEGDRSLALRMAIRRLQECAAVERLSDVYETEPAYVVDQPRYLNMVVEATTHHEPHDLLRCLKHLERELGRVVGMRWGPRPIDLDIILYGDRQVATEDLQIPHIRFHERQFVLRPLAELVPELVAPGQSSTIQQLADRASIGEILSRLGPLPKYPDQP